jgi:hypothetical protein
MSLPKLRKIPGVPPRFSKTQTPQLLLGRFAKGSKHGHWDMARADGCLLDEAFTQFHHARR